MRRTELLRAPRSRHDQASQFELNNYVLVASRASPLRRRPIWQLILIDTRSRAVRAGGAGASVRASHAAGGCLC